MKTQEEIEQLAEQYWDKQPYNEDAFVKGYNQCQKDMVDKKYTEQDLNKAINLARKTIVNKWGANGEESIDFVHSNTKIMQLLNKQD
jgi:hypothetical protein